jgi:ATP-dependent protease ClpP protease subunit
MPWIDVPGDRPGFKAQARARTEPWYRFKNIAADEAELFLYDEIGGWGTYADEFVAELKNVTAPKLRVRVNSPGGSVFEGLAVANALRSHPAEVTVQVDGLAASIASVIAMAADRVVVQPQAMVMIHDASGGCFGNAQDMQQMADLLDKLSDNIASAYAAKAGGTAADWRAKMLAESWFTAQEAVDAGLADEVAGAPKAADEPDEDDPAMALAARWDLTVFRYAGRDAAPAPQPAAKAEPEQPVPAAEAMRRIAAAAHTTPPADETPAPEAPAEPVPAAPEPQAEQPDPTDPPAAEPEPEPAEPADEWAALTAHLFTPEPSITDVFARLKEALL